jgi:hypothetical protein
MPILTSAPKIGASSWTFGHPSSAISRSFAIDDFGHRRHLRGDGIELIAAGHDDLVWRDDGGFAHAAWQILFAAERFQVAEPVRRGDVADDLGVRHVVVIEDIVSLSLVDLKPGQTFVHVENEVVGVVFPASPLIEAEIALFGNRFGRRPAQHGLAFLGRQFAGMVTGQIFLHFRMKPPGSDDGSANGHLKSSLCACVFFRDACEVFRPRPRRPGTIVGGRFQAWRKSKPQAPRARLMPSWSSP